MGINIHITRNSHFIYIIVYLGIVNGYGLYMYYYTFNLKV